MSYNAGDAYVADAYGCPVHDHGYSSVERRCSCRFFWASDDTNMGKVNIVAKMRPEETREQFGKRLDVQTEDYKNS